MASTAVVSDSSADNPSGKPSFVVRISRKGKTPREVEFDSPRLLIGRDSGDIVLKDPGASARHAEIRFADGTVKLRDLGSTNGTWLGTRQITSETMVPGKLFTMGESTIELIAVRGTDPDGAATMLIRRPAAEAAGGAPLGTKAQQAPDSSYIVSGGATGGWLSGIASRARAVGQKLGELSPKTQRTLGISAVALAAIAGGMTLIGGDGKNRARGLESTTETTVKAVWFRGPAGPQASGGTTPSTVRISPNQQGGASVGVLEEFAGGAGNQWRTATWLAAFRASQLNGQSLTDYEFLVRTGGHIDGPSAGMLMTATMLAMLRGVEVRADTTMTGTINPDGSAGPVGGIVQKMAGAADDGITRFGFPMGSRNHRDLRTGGMVDLFAKGAELGLEVREIHDIFEAYEFLTGDQLERVSPIGDAEMELDAETAERLRNKIAKWTARVTAEIAGLKNATRGLGQLAERIRPLAAEADREFAQAESFARSDFLASAYESYVKAAVYAGMTKDAARFLEAARSNDIEAMVSQVEECATVKGKLTALLGEAELQAKRETGGGQINTLRSFQSAVIADSYQSMADNAYSTARRIRELQQQGKASAKQVEAVPELLFEAVTYYSVAETMIDVAEDQKDFGAEQGVTAPLDLAVIGRSAAAYGSAAGAVLQYLESLTIDDAAREAGIDRQTAKQRLAANDQEYLLASRAVRIAEGVSGKANEANMLRLAAGSMAFLKGASLVNKYYSLGGQVDQAGVLTLTNKKALSAQLDLARQLAREAAAKAKKHAGFVPVAARLAYQLGVARREGSDEDKLFALEAYWESAFWSELLAVSQQR